ncbi:hypothetical protein O6H91_03G019700 [Diphasiastrum complanatum]|uniref:Uncharacterized protein n=1 Tax=Diphasiastrum complanatum TaxID=34168 RepID=A0ACC2E4S1_DIPCM|nr:hypothetical protein O6H91_03G019700 [Diphasiastrum complanatum]
MHSMTIGIIRVQKTLYIDLQVASSYFISQITDPYGVRSSYGDVIHKDEQLQNGLFSFTSKGYGDYLMCFSMHNPHSSLPVSVDLILKLGWAAKDWNMIAKKEKIEGMELKLKRLADMVYYIHTDMLYLKKRGLWLSMISKKTESRVAWLTSISILISLLMAGWQILHIRSYFKKKSIL